MAEKLFALKDLLMKVKVQLEAIGDTGNDEFDAGAMLLIDALKMAEPMLDRGSHVIYTEELWRKMGEQN